MKTFLLVLLAFIVGSFVITYVVNTVRLIIVKRKERIVNNKEGEEEK